MFPTKKKRYQTRGFTLTESLIIVAVVGIIAVIAAPSFGGLLDSVRLNQTITEIRVSLSSAQRQAIRKGDVCDVGVMINHPESETVQTNFPSELYTDCSPSEEQTFSNKIRVTSNIKPLGLIASDIEFSDEGKNKKDKDKKDKDDKESKKAAKNAAWCEKHKTHNHKNWDKKCSGSQTGQGEPINFSEASFSPDGHLNFYIQKGSNTIASDSSGKIVIYNLGKETNSKKCIAISRRLGLTRLGNYKGKLDSVSITEDGICTSIAWDKQ